MPLRLCSLLSALLSSISARCGGPWASGDPVRSAVSSSDTVFSTGLKRPSQKDLGRKALPSALSLDSWPPGQPVTMDWSLSQAQSPGETE